MGVNFGARKKAPIVIEDDEPSPKVDEEITISDEEPEKPETFANDDMSFVNEFKQMKKEQNTKLFEKMEKNLDKDRSRKSRSPQKSSTIDFEAEMRRAKEKKAAEKLAEEVAKKDRQEKLRRNALAFDRLAKSRDDSRSKNRKKSSRTEVRDDFLSELKKTAPKKPTTSSTSSKPPDPPVEKSSERIKLDRIV